MPNVSIRPWQKDDINSYFDLCHESLIKKYFNTLYCRSKKEVSSLFKILNKKNYLCYIIEKDDKPVGFILGIIQQFSVEVRYFVGKDYRGLGISSNAILKLQNEVTNPNIKSFHFKIAKDNSSSISIMNKIEADFIKQDKDWIYYNYPI